VKTTKTITMTELEIKNALVDWLRDRRHIETDDKVSVKFIVHQHTGRPSQTIPQVYMTCEAGDDIVTSYEPTVLDVVRA
jgi:hypothetical protein